MRRSAAKAPVALALAGVFSGCAGFIEPPLPASLGIQSLQNTQAHAAGVMCDQINTENGPADNCNELAMRAMTRIMPSLFPSELPDVIRRQQYYDFFTRVFGDESSGIYEAAEIFEGKKQFTSEDLELFTRYINTLPWDEINRFYDDFRIEEEARFYVSATTLTDEEKDKFIQTVLELKSEFAANRFVFEMWLALNMGDEGLSPEEWQQRRALAINETIEKLTGQMQPPRPLPGWRGQALTL